MKLKLITIALFAAFAPALMNAKSKKAETPASLKNVVVIEAESTKSDLGKWIKVTPADSNYVNNAGGNAHIEFTGNTINGGNADSPLEYEFTVPQTGVYQLIIRCNKRLMGVPGDKCNDGWVKVAGNFESGNEIPTDDLKKDEKFFGGAAGVWGWGDQLDWQGHIKRYALYKFTAGEKYTFVMSGRSIRWNVDKIIFFDTLSYKMDDIKKIIDPESMKVDETPLKWNMKVEGFVPAYYDGGNKAFAINTIKEPTDKWAAATQVFKGKKGKYTVNFTSLCELDGECSYKVFIDGKEIISTTNPRIHGTNKVDYTPNVVSVKDVKLKTGSIVKVEFLSHSNKLVPEKDAFGYARARWRDIEFVKQ